MDRRFRHRNKKKFWIAFPLIIGMIFLLVWLVQWLWNLLLPEILGVKAISYWQAFGIMVLSKILFGGFRFRGGGGGRNFKEKVKRRMEEFSDEDKERFREEWQKRFGDRCRFK
ncbi:hypothetical protein HZP39_10630 [Elizabethkingia anophelis]|nr:MULTISPECIES: hypothetical protein [Elizabethkingia]AKH96078.1 hypothetical protein M876_16110 [Elizabethkingia anophelis FMS-007]AMR42066.1 hypothetical protein A2T74_12260 [Elizabethkingia anophelis]AMX48706.1 hypothetical protein A4C56_12260 [Elizabethkingia anophelis]AMX52164.1 hypothetical protein A2T72_12260 [Elizabethkingia anophelis]AMX55553.1 hypothetical protein A2T59_12260 [Elizabethkingia anophelis]